MATIRICVCGDEGTGKTSIITSLIKDTFVSGRLQPVLPPITLPTVPASDLSVSSQHSSISTVIVDTSALPHERDNLRKELRKANVILLVYSDNYTFERIALFWLPFFRTLGVNVPVVLCASKADQRPEEGGGEFQTDEMLALMSDFKEIDSCIRTSSKNKYNIVETFYLCQKAVTHPIGPLYDAKESALKPAAIAALRRIFYLCDKDQDGYLNDKEIHAFQLRCFDKPLGDEELQSIKHTIQKISPQSAQENGINVEGFLLLNKVFAEKGRHETIWTILRKFHYTDSLSLHETFLHPAFVVQPFASAELSPQGYRFFVDLFLLHDKDNDGGLNAQELEALFAPTPGLPPSWVDSAFPSCAVRNEAGHITLQGWLAQWSMTTFEESKTTLEYLAYLGFESGDSRNPGTTAALRLTKPRKNRSRPGRVERNVFLCYVLGGAGSGKTSLLDAFLARPFRGTHTPTIKSRSAVNSVELPGGKQCYLILCELGEVETAILENQSKLDACDLLCYTYDSSDPDGFAHVAELRAKYPALEAMPSVFVALKADLDKSMQRQEVQPDEYCAERKMAMPLHTSVKWSSIQELFAQIAECATLPSHALPRRDDQPPDRTHVYLGAGATIAALAAAVIVWKKSTSASSV